MSRRKASQYSRTVIPGLIALSIVVALILWLTHGGTLTSIGAQPECQPSEAATEIPITLPCQTPAYTTDDARAYVEAAGFPGGKTTTGKPFTFQTVEFITREEAEIHMHGASLEGQVASGDIVCYVELIGPFDGAGAHMPPDAKPNISELAKEHGVMIFDAHTGLLLAWGLYEPITG